MAKTVTMDLNDYELIQEKRKTAEMEVEKLKRELVDARLGNTTDLARQMVDAFRSSLEVARYATGMCGPEFSRKWPMKDLIKVADSIDLMPDISPQEHELAIEFRSFAREIERWDRLRDESYKAPPSLADLSAEGERRVIVSRSTGSLPMVKETP